MRAQLQATTQRQGMIQHPKGEAPGADPVLEKGLGGLEAAGPQGWLTLQPLHCLGS